MPVPMMPVPSTATRISGLPRMSQDRVMGMLRGLEFPVSGRRCTKPWVRG